MSECIKDIRNLDPNYYLLLKEDHKYYIILMIGERYQISKRLYKKLKKDSNDEKEERLF